jgi:transposase
LDWKTVKDLDKEYMAKQFEKAGMPAPKAIGIDEISVKKGHEYRIVETKVPLGFVEGMNNKIRVFQRRAYGLRDEEYLRLKVLTCMLPEI